MHLRLVQIVELATVCTFAVQASAQTYGQPAAQPSAQPAYGQQGAQSAPYGQQAPAGNDGFESGGLAPPSPMGPNPNQPQQQYQTETQRQLSDAEKEDSGRGLEWVYFNVEGGYQYLGLETFKSDGLTYAKSVSSTDGGMMLGAGAGVRLIFITLGGRARVGMFDQWNVATINAEVGFHIPIGMVEPYFVFGGGYAFLGSMDAGNWGGDVSVRGWNLRAGFGLDYYVTPAFSIGGNLTADALFLFRPGVDLSDTSNTELNTVSQRAAQADGSSVGAALTGSAMLGLHF
ncbi:MAG: hypothetical protein CSA75_01690 [Sorangium cellulosum]|nr:MAG: hypothetical protein CSA75_01690 [Sorangium cellulosum]